MNLADLLFRNPYGEPPDATDFEKWRWVLANRVGIEEVTLGERQFATFDAPNRPKVIVHPSGFAVFDAQGTLITSAHP